MSAVTLAPCAALACLTFPRAFRLHVLRTFLFSPTGQVDAFRVDGIPHLAMVNADGDVETAIIGTVPKDVSSVLLPKTLAYRTRWGRSLRSPRW